MGTTSVILSFAAPPEKDLSLCSAFSRPNQFLRQSKMASFEQSQYPEGRACLLNGKSEYPEGRACLANGKSEYPEGRARLANSKSQYPEGRARLALAVHFNANNMNCRSSGIIVVAVGLRHYARPA